MTRYEAELRDCPPHLIPGPDAAWRREVSRINEGPLDGPQMRVIYAHGWEAAWKGYRGKCFHSYDTAQRWAFCTIRADIDRVTPSGV